MTGFGVLGAVVQVIVVVFGAPLLVGVLGQVRAKLTGRVGAGIGAPWRELRKLARKEPLAPDGTGEVFRFAPLVLAGSTVVVVAVTPLLTTYSPLDHAADLFAVVALLTLGTLALALAGLDTGTGFGGMGASRMMTVLALAQPTLLVAILALSVRAGSTNLGAIVSSTLDDPARVLAPASLLAAAALVVVIITEAGRPPVDDPAGFPETATSRGATVLDYAGPDLAMVELASAMRLTVLLGLLANLFLPWGIAAEQDVMALLVGLGALVGKVLVLGIALAAGEVFLARLRMLRVRELLAGSFLLALLAMSASFFLA